MFVPDSRGDAIVVAAGIMLIAVVVPLFPASGSGAEPAPTSLRKAVQQSGDDAIARFFTVANNFYVDRQFKIITSVEADRQEKEILSAARTLIDKPVAIRTRIRNVGEVRDDDFILYIGPFKNVPWLTNLRPTDQHRLSRTNGPNGFVQMSLSWKSGEGTFFEITSQDRFAAEVGKDPLVASLRAVTVLEDVRGLAKGQDVELRGRIVTFLGRVVRHRNQLVPPQSIQGVDIIPKTWSHSCQERIPVFVVDSIASISEPKSSELPSLGDLRPDLVPSDNGIVPEFFAELNRYEVTGKRLLRVLRSDWEKSLATKALDLVGKAYEIKMTVGDIQERVWTSVGVPGGGYFGRHHHFEITYEDRSSPCQWRSVVRHDQDPGDRVRLILSAGDETRTGALLLKRGQRIAVSGTILGFGTSVFPDVTGVQGTPLEPPAKPTHELVGVAWGERLPDYSLYRRTLFLRVTKIAPLGTEVDWEGKVVSGRGSPRVYFVHKGVRYWVGNWAYVEPFGLSAATLQWVDSKELEALPEGFVIKSIDDMKGCLAQ